PDLRGFEWHYWNRLCHAELRTITLSKTSSDSLAVFSPDGTRLAVVSNESGSSAQVIKVWDAQTGAERHAFTLPRDQGYQGITVTWHPDGNHLAVFFDDRNGSVQLRMWDLTAGMWLYAINEHSSVERFQ